MLCKPDYLYVNGFLEIRILSQSKNPNFSYPLLQKKISQINSAVLGVTDRGKFNRSGSKSRNDLLVELQKKFTSEPKKYHVTNLFDVCINGDFVTINAIKYKNVKSNTITNKTISEDNGILLMTNNQRCILSEIKYDGHFFSKINNLGSALCK